MARLLKTLDNSDTLQRQPEDPLPDYYVGGRGKVEAARAEAETIGKINDTINRFADDQAILAGTNDGLKAGMKPDFQPLRGTSLYAQAHDKAGVQVFVNGLKLEASRNAERIYNENRGNPEALQKALDSWAGGFEANLFDEAKPGFRDTWGQHSLVYMDRAKAEHEKNLIDNTIASTAQASEAQFNDVTAAARTLRDDRQFAVLAATQREAYLARMLEHAPREGGEYEGQKIEADPTRLPAFTWQEIEKNMRSFDQAVAIERVMGKFERAPDKVAFQKMWLQTARTTESTRFSPDIIEKINNRMEAEIRHLKTVAAINKIDASSAFQSAKERLLKGYELPAAEEATLGNLIAASGDVKLQAQFDALKANSEFLINLRQMSPMQIDGLINTQLVPAAKNDGATQAEADMLELAQGALKGIREESGRDPMAFAASSGQAVLQPIFQKDSSTGNYVINPLEVNRRSSIASFVGDKYATEKRLFTDVEATQLSSIYNAATPEAAMSFIETIGAPLRMNPEALNAVARQIAPKSKVMASAIAASTENIDTAKKIVLGSRLDYKLPPKVDEAIDFQLGRAVQDPEARRNIAEGIKAVFTYDAFRAKLDPSVALNTDDKKIKSAVEQVVGPILEMNDNSEILSWKYAGQQANQDTLDDVLDELKDYGPAAIKAGHGDIPEQLKGGAKIDRMLRDEWVSLGNGNYMIKDAAGLYYSNKDGRPFIISMPKIQLGIAELRIKQNGR